MKKNQGCIRILLGTTALQADTVAINLDGHRVWLKESFTPQRKLVGVIDCCRESAPCAWHRALAQSRHCNLGPPKQKQ
jgi:hypothetical protein